MRSTGVGQVSGQGVIRVTGNPTVFPYDRRAQFHFPSRYCGPVSITKSVCASHSWVGDYPTIWDPNRSKKRSGTGSRPIRRRELAPKGQLTEVLNGLHSCSCEQSAPGKAALSIRSAIQLAPSELLERAKMTRASDDHQGESDLSFSRVGIR